MTNATKVIINARNNYGAWRYKLEPNGDNDSSITGWMIFALKTAEDNKIQIDHAAYEGARDVVRVDGGQEHRPRRLRLRRRRRRPGLVPVASRPLHRQVPGPRSPRP